MQREQLAQKRVSAAMSRFKGWMAGHAQGDDVDWEAEAKAMQLADECRAKPKPAINHLGLFCPARCPGHGKRM